MKSGSIPAKADAVAQREYYSDICTLMMKAKAGLLTLMFLDGSHFVMGCDFLGHIYCKTRRFIKTLSGCKRYNVLGGYSGVEYTACPGEGNRHTVLLETVIPAQETN